MTYTSFDPTISTEDITLTEFLDGTLIGEFPASDNIREGSIEEVNEYRNAKAFGDMPAYIVIDLGNWHLIYTNTGSVPVEDDITIIAEGEKAYTEEGVLKDYIWDKFMPNDGVWAAFVEAIKTEEEDEVKPVTEMTKSELEELIANMPRQYGEALSRIEDALGSEFTLDDLIAEFWHIQSDRDAIINKLNKWFPADDNTATADDIMFVLQGIYYNS